MRQRIFILLIALFVASSPLPAAAESPHGTYQIDFVPITTPFGTPSITEAQVRSWVSNANAFYDSISGGKIKLEFRTLYPVESSSSFLDTPAGIKTKFPNAAAPKSATAIKSVLVGVMSKNTNYWWAGEAMRGGEEIIFNGISAEDTVNTSVFVHEFGHILGLAHANSIYCPPNVLVVNCELTEYGDYSDVMGTYVKSYVSYEGRFNAVSLDRLDLLPDSSIYLATNSADIELQPLYSTQSGYKLIYLPIYNRMGYSVEYRPAVGMDSWLSQTRVTTSNNWYYNNTPSYGLQVRTIGSQNSESESWLPKTDKDNYNIYFNSNKSRQGLDAGESITLPDGSVVSFISGSGDSAVKLRIDRPADITAPKVVTGELSYLEQAKFPKLEVSYNGLTDDRYVAKLELLINGQVVNTLTNPGDTGSIDYQLTSGKPYSYQLVATDFAGNKSQSPETKATVDCTNKKCYVGAVWNVEGPSFGATIKLPKAQLQELVSGKWVTRATAPQVKADGLLTYKLKYSPKKAGTATYRIFIPASAKWAAWVGKTFKQKVIG